MNEYLEAAETTSCSQDSIEVEIVSDEEFQMLDEAIQNAMMEGWICHLSCYTH